MMKASKHLRLLFVAMCLMLVQAIQVDAEFDQELNDKMREAVAQLPKSELCHDLGVKYYQSYPHWVVGSNAPNSGFSTSDEYKGAHFDPISLQRPAIGQKKYVLPLFYGEVSEEAGVEQSEADMEFLGFVSYKVNQVIEPYYAHRLGDASSLYRKRILALPFGSEELSDGHHRVLPLQFTAPAEDPITGIFTAAFRERIVFEECFDPQPHAPSGSFHKYDESLFNYFFGTSPPLTSSEYTYDYGSSDAPTYLGYDICMADTAKSWQEFYDNMEAGIEFVAASTPLVGTIMLGIECSHSGDPSCIGELVTSAALDVLTAGQIKGLATLGKFGAAVTSAQAPARYVVLAGNFTLAGIYGAQGNTVAATLAGLGVRQSYISIREAGRLSVVKIRIDEPQCSRLASAPSGKTKVNSDYPGRHIGFDKGKAWTELKKWGEGINVLRAKMSTKGQEFHSCLMEGTVGGLTIDEITKAFEKIKGIGLDFRKNCSRCVQTAFEVANGSGPCCANAGSNCNINKELMGFAYRKGGIVDPDASVSDLVVNASTSSDFAQNAAKKFPPGTGFMAFILYDDEKLGGHVLNAFHDTDGRVFFYDGQSHKFMEQIEGNYPSFELLGFLPINYPLAYLRD